MKRLLLKDFLEELLVKLSHMEFFDIKFTLLYLKTCIFFFSFKFLEIFMFEGRLP